MQAVLLLMSCALGTVGIVSTGSCVDSGNDGKIIVISAILNEQTIDIAKEVLERAYGKIGYHVKFNDLPGQRALEWANNGLTDGDVARIKGTEQKYPNLIPVPTPVIYFQGVAFVKTINNNIEAWSDLKGLRIGIVRGIRYSEIGTKGMDPFHANDMQHLFTLLDLGRIQVAVAALDSGKIEIERHFKDSGIHPTGSPLFSSPLYHFLNKRNKNLVERIDRVLMEMARTGETDQLWRQAFEKAIHR